jgi:membrane associated rhomboid family serine protease
VTPRTYIRDWEPGGGGAGPAILPPAIKALLIANGAIFALQLVAQYAFSYSLVSFGGLSPAMVAHGAIWQLFTYMFLHGSLLHILFNMFALWMFGRELEYDWGTRAFFKYYLICGIGAGVVTLLALWGKTNPTIGASGAIYGVLLAFGMAYPNRYIFLWFLVPIKAKYLVILFGALEVLASVSSTGDGIGHLTHLGGLAVGFLYLRLSAHPWHYPRPLAWMGQWQARRKGQKLRHHLDEQRLLMEEVDRILDRINQVGFEGLTDEEKLTLERASRRLSTPSPKK